MDASKDFGVERRQFIRIKTNLVVRYKFICQYRDEPELNKVYEGYTENISASGLLLVGKIPKFEWIPELLMKKISIGVNLYLPSQEFPIKALTRVVWLEKLEEETKRCFMGLQFQEIRMEDKDKIFFFVIKNQLDSS